MGQMMEPVRLRKPPFMQEEEIKANKPWAIVGYGSATANETVLILRMQPDELEMHVEKALQKICTGEKELWPL
jgi:hypothetical protein